MSPTPKLDVEKLAPDLSTAQLPRHSKVIGELTRLVSKFRAGFVAFVVEWLYRGASVKELVTIRDAANARRDELWASGDSEIVEALAKKHFYYHRRQLYCTYHAPGGHVTRKATPEEAEEAGMVLLRERKKPVR